MERVVFDVLSRHSGTLSFEIDERNKGRITVSHTNYTNDPNESQKRKLEIPEGSENKRQRLAV